MRLLLYPALHITLALAAAGCVLPGGQRVDPLSGGQQVKATPRPLLARLEQVA